MSALPDGMDDLADQLGLGRDGRAALLRDMASAGMLDAGALSEGTVRAHVVDEAIDKWDSIIEAERAAGRASGEARRRKAAERSSNDVQNND